MAYKHMNFNFQDAAQYARSCFSQYMLPFSGWNM